ncbi:unnamed protein product [Peronospora destructor]|uniref:Uncharacterized protein n=1 Tax=Peronospora destructor TaxID=86335 RepID=A0AAV0TVT5_9STRA|nr:unnamed protein product [Peronospora destructor]
MKDQGKGARIFGGAGSAFLTRPRGLWEIDLRFAVAIRLNQLDTHSVLKCRRLRAHDKCRFLGCSRSKTLEHVLNHCVGAMDAVRTRHDEAVKVIERKVAASAGAHADRVELWVNQTVPSLPGPALRPDLQVYNHSKLTGGNLVVCTEHLGLLKCDAKLMDRHLSADYITSSRRIWNMHCSMHRARQRPGHSRPASRGSQLTETGGTPSHNSLR